MGATADTNARRLARALAAVVAHLATEDEAEQHDQLETILSMPILNVNYYKSGACLVHMAQIIKYIN